MEFIEKAVCFDRKRLDRPRVCCCSAAGIIAADLILTAWAILSGLAVLADRLKEIIFFLGGEPRYQPALWMKSQVLEWHVVILRHSLVNTELMALFFVITLIAVTTRHRQTLKAVIILRYINYIFGFFLYVGVTVLFAVLLHTGAYRSVGVGHTFVFFGTAWEVTPRAVAITLLVAWLVLWPLVILWQALMLRAFFFYLHASSPLDMMTEKEQKHLLEGGKDAQAADEAAYGSTSSSSV